MGFFASINKKMILSSFQNDFDKFRLAPLETQLDVGRKIWADIEEIAKWDVAKLNNNQSKLREHYKALRHEAMKAGAENERNPTYAYPALMESLVCSLGDNIVFLKIMSDIQGWLALIGVIQRENN